MSAGVLKYTLVVRKPDGLTPVALLAGQPVPEWAEDLVHADDLISDSDVGDTVPYEKQKKAALEALVASRNEGRDDDDLIEVEAPGNKAELIAALEADDAAQADPGA